MLAHAVGTNDRRRRGLDQPGSKTVNGPEGRTHRTTSPRRGVPASLGLTHRPSAGLPLGVHGVVYRGSDGYTCDKGSDRRSAVAYSPLRKRQSGWPAGSSMMRMLSGLRSGGYHGASVPPASRAVSTAASRSSTSTSK